MNARELGILRGLSEALTLIAAGLDRSCSYQLSEVVEARVRLDMIRKNLDEMQGFGRPPISEPVEK
jgi:hypothetical protein